MHKFLIILIVSLMFSCSSNESESYATIKFPKHNPQITQHISIDSLKDWHTKDLLIDSIPGISLERAFNTILKNTKGKPVIIAVLDTKIDIHHEAFAGYIWENPNETPNNYIDDDSNGYIDDIHGWNFLGNHNGETITVENYEYVRIIRYYEQLKKNGNLELSSSLESEYLRAKKVFEAKKVSAKKRLEHSDKIISFYLEAREALKSYFPDYKYSLDVLNSIDTVGNGLSKYVEEIRLVIKYNDTDKNMIRYNQDQRDTYYKKLNLSYFPRNIIGDDVNDLRDSIYGNNMTYDYLETFTHGTRVTGVITGNTQPKLRNRYIKILPVSILPYSGSTHDKDIALGIKYAVDQGAKVINMSFGKTFSMHSEWLKNAFLYAKKNNVVIVSAAGNDYLNLDDNPYIYPNDSYEGNPEFTDNFIYVGATSHNLDSNFVTFSNYSKTHVDVFAPGDSIFTSFPNNKYRFDSGTSLASALTSKVVALLYAYYPSLSAAEIKQIIMDSGIEFPYLINTSNSTQKKKTPFRDLSKSGKMINAYNAFVMADSISKSKLSSKN